jgi:hypothetical protein
MAIESPKEIAEIMEQNQTVPPKKEKMPIVSNHTGYHHEGSENFEHDDMGSSMNHSGVEDELNNAESMHDGWQEGYDY